MPYTTVLQPTDLAALLPAPSALICDCRFDLADPSAGRRAYADGHLPGAVYLDLDADLSGTKTGTNGRHPLPDRQAFASRMAAIGLSSGTQVIAYDAADGMFAARLWALLRWIGHAEVAVLDGGLAGWTASGGALETAAPPAQPRGDLADAPLADAPLANAPLADAPSLLTLAEYDDVREASGAGSRLIVDARAPDRFRGENETLDPVGGHIPGAVNRFFRANLGDGARFKPAAILRQEFTALLDGRNPSQVIAQCGSGVTACHNLLAMEIAGLSGAALYPGSWSEWSSRPGAPIARG